MAALRGVEHVVHAGDVGAPEILDGLRALAALTAVRGNVDRAPWARALADREVVEVGGLTIYVLHDLAEIDLDPAAAGFQVVVSGHTHAPSVQRRGGVLYVNPGSAGPRRFRLPVSVGILQAGSGGPAAQIVELATR